MQLHRNGKWYVIFENSLALLLFIDVLWQPETCGKGGDGGFMFVLLPQKRKNCMKNKSSSPENVKQHEIRM